MTTLEERAESARIRCRRTITCEECGFAFNCKPSELGRRFCTIKCRRDWERKNLTIGNYKTSRDVIYDHSIPEPNTGCWIWFGASGAKGYGKVRRRGLYTGSAHKLSFMAFDPEQRDIIEVLVSLIGFELDHKCNLRCCVNWQHLEPVTHTENVRRQSRNSGSGSRQADLASQQERQP